MTKIAVNDPLNDTLLTIQSAKDSGATVALDFWDRGKTWFTRSLAISTSIGVFIVTLYFLRIRYLPIDSISSMGSLGGIVAWVAFAMLAAFVVLWGAPTAVVLFFKSTSSWLLISHRFWSHKVDIDYRNQAHTVSGARVFAFVTLAIGVLWLYFLFLTTEDFVIPKQLQSLAVWLLGVIWILGLFWFLHERRPPVSDFGPIKLETGLKGYLVRAGWFIFFSFSGAYPLLAFAQMSTMSSMDASGRLAEGLWLLCGLVAVVALHSVNLGIELSKSTDSQAIAWKFQIGVTVFCVFTVLAMLGATIKLHDQLMQAISVRVPHAHIVVQKSTCDALRLAGISTSRYSALPGEVTTDSCILLDITVLSKLGAQWRIACARDAAAASNYRGFNILAKDVITLVDVRRPDRSSADVSDVCMSMWTP